MTRVQVRIRVMTRPNKLLHMLIKLINLMSLKGLVLFFCCGLRFKFSTWQLKLKSPAGLVKLVFIKWVVRNFPECDLD